MKISFVWKKDLPEIEHRHFQLKKSLQLASLDCVNDSGKIIKETEQGVTEILFR